MSSKILTLSPSAIVIEGLQLRTETNREHIDDIAELFDEDNPTWPDDLPAVIVFCDGTKHYLADGHHRLAAAIEAGCTEIRVDVRKGTKQDATLFACGANAGHGLRRTNKDKRNAVTAAYRINPGNTARGIARICKVSHGMAEYIVRELKESAAKNTGQEKEKLANLANKDLPSSKSEVGNPSYGGPDAGGTEGHGATPSRSVGAQEPANHAPTAGPISPSASSDDPCILDEVGLPIPPGLAEEAFASLDLFDAIERELREAARLINQLATMSGAELYRSEHLRLKHRMKDGQFVEAFHSADVENAIKELRHWRPYASVCPHCKDAPKQTCKVCRGLPYLIEYAWSHTPEKLRKAVIDERTKGHE